MIRELFEKAGELHGHYCPGLAIGVRAAAEALKLLGTEKGGHGLYCIAESRACYMDGIQSVFGTTWGGGNLELRDRGKTAFNFYDRTTGKSLRLVSKDWPSGLEKSEMIEFLLNEPLGNVFSVTETRFEAPEDSFVRQPSQPCAVCGEMCREPFLRVSEGRLVCLDCAEKKLKQ